MTADRRKDLYEVGEIPPLGHVPAKMHAWAIRRERHGEPDRPSSSRWSRRRRSIASEVLVLVMAAGVNYNGIWAGLGKPISPFDVHKAEYHIAGLRRLGHRLGGGRQGQALQGRRRSRGSL